MFRSFLFLLFVGCSPANDYTDYTCTCTFDDGAGEESEEIDMGCYEDAAWSSDDAIDDAWTTAQSSCEGQHAQCACSCSMGSGDRC